MLSQINWSDVIGKVIAGLIVAAILAIASWAKSPRFRLLVRRLWNTVIEWLGRQWRYLVIVILLILIQVTLYLVYANWRIIVFSIAHLALVMLAVLLLFAPKRSPIVSSLDATRGLIQKIDFGYFPEESPIRKGWALAGGTLPEFTPADYSGGKALTIQQVGLYALDYDFDPGTRLGKSVEFVAKFKSGAAIYAQIDVKSKERAASERGWIQFRVGISQPEKLPSGNEWVLYIMPQNELEGKWQLFREDLINATKQTFGTEGKSFERLIGFRLRGNLELAYIAVFE